MLGFRLVSFAGTKICNSIVAINHTETQRSIMMDIRQIFEASVLATYSLHERNDTTYYYKDKMMLPM